MNIAIHSATQGHNSASNIVHAEKLNEWVGGIWYVAILAVVIVIILAAMDDVGRK